MDHAPLLGFPYIAIKLNVNGDIVPRELPWVEIEPVIGDLNLIAIDNLLLENTIPVPESVAPSWKVHRRQTVEEARGKSAEATISESCIMFLGNDVLDSKAQVFETI